MTKQQDFVNAVIEWDNKHNDGNLQRSRFNAYALETEGRTYYDPNNPKVIPDEQWETFEQHMNGYLNGFADDTPGTMSDAVGCALDRLFDHIKE